jgi:hypothetical protein
MFCRKYNSFSFASKLDSDANIFENQDKGGEGCFELLKI